MNIEDYKNKNCPVCKSVLDLRIDLYYNFGGPQGGLGEEISYEEFLKIDFEKQKTRIDIDWIILDCISCKKYKDKIYPSGFHQDKLYINEFLELQSNTNLQKELNKSYLRCTNKYNIATKTINYINIRDWLKTNSLEDLEDKLNKLMALL